MVVTRWRPILKNFGPTAALAPPAGTADATVSFDPIRQHPPGLTHYPLFIRLRERSYATARAHRHHSHGEPC